MGQAWLEGAGLAEEGDDCLIVHSKVGMTRESWRRMSVMMAAMLDSSL